MSRGELPISEIKIGKRFRKDLGDIDGLAASMGLLGLLQPIGVASIDGETRLVFGQRRLRAAQKLGWATIPARVVKVDALLAEHDENEVRKQFTVSERVAIAEAMKARIGERRGGDRTKGKVDSYPQCSEVPDGEKTREHVARQAGFESDFSFRQAKTVVEGAAPELVQAMDEGLVSISLAAQLAKKYDEKQQREVVARMRAAQAEGAKANENLARNAVREIRREERIENLAEISKASAALDGSLGRFPVIYADPPWRYEHAESESRAIENQYPTMDLDAICALDLASCTTDDAVLFCWATSPKLAEALSVIEAWGFSYRTCIVWDKERIGMGYYARQQHELLLICTKGSPPAPPPDARPPSVYREPRDAHSAKPHRFYELIEAMYPELPKLELFCRSPRSGWSVWGNQSAA